MTFATLLTDELVRADISDSHLAKLAGVTRATIHNLRTGRVNPSLEVFCKLVRVMPTLAAIIYTLENGTTAARPRNRARGGPEDARSSRSKS